MPIELESIPFDHYQRYAATAALVDALGMPTATVLEVGANRQRLLASFLPRSKLVFSDLFEQTGVDDFVQADASALPFSDARFDAVVALDVIEHMPAHLRAKAAVEMARVATRLVVIACPLDQPWVHAAEHDANGVWRNYFGEDYPWLEEHKEFGLVAGDEIEQALLESGYIVLRFGQGDTKVWAGLMSAHFVKEAIAEMRPLVASADRLYNHSVFAGDRSEKSYREYFIAVRSESDLERIRQSSVLVAQPDDAAVSLLSSLGASLQPIADRIRAAESQWQLAAKKVADGDAKLTAAAAEWGHAVELLHESEAKQLHASEQWQATAELVRSVEASLEDARDQWATTVEKLRESEGKQMYASQQWQATVELMQAADAGLTDTREQWARTLEQLHESEAKQFYVTQQWQLTAERVRAAESGLEDARAEWADTVERLRDSEAKQLYASEQWRLTAERFREAEVQLKQLRLQHQSLGQQFTETDVRLQAELHIRQEREAVLSQTLDQLRRQTVETERARERLGELEKQHEEAVESMCLLEEKHQLLIAEHGELAYHQDRLLTRVRGLECRQRWAIGGVVIVFLTAIAGFFLRLI
jgi:hypothetical protein